jgi:hypothetical protein
MGQVPDFAADLNWLALAVKEPAAGLRKAPNRDAEILSIEWPLKWLKFSPFVWAYDPPIEIDERGDLSSSERFSQGVPRK